MTLESFISDFAAALKTIDERGNAHKHFRPGIGPYGESDAVRAALAILKEGKPDVYAKAGTKRQPDLLIPGQWQVEFKVVRPFGDNGNEAENWSQNLLHPYLGNTSSIGDCFKLAAASGPEKKAIVVFGYEHDPPRISLDPCVNGFEILCEQLLKIKLTKRVEVRMAGLIHPVHQVLRVFGWEVVD